jgi:DNA-binding response OmpR family regulator
VANMTAVLVDDSEQELGVLRRLLTQNGVEVVAIATSGNAGLRDALARRPTFVMLDINLPDVSGLEIAAKIIDAKTGSKIVMCSGAAQSAVQKQARSIGADLFICKPYDDILTWREIAAMLDRG